MHLAPTALQIEKLSALVSDRILSLHFANSTTVSGAQLASTPTIPAVDLFLLYNLRTAWDKENEKLKSPFFDYKAADVQEALKRFQNTLSRNILIDKAEFKNLLTTSIQDSIQVVLNPVAFFPEKLVYFAKPAIAIDHVATLFKYTSVYKLELDGILKELRSNGSKDTLKGDFSLMFYQAIVPDRKQEAATALWQSIKQFVGGEAEVILDGPKAPIAAQPEASTSFFDDFDAGKSADPITSAPEFATVLQVNQKPSVNSETTPVLSFGPDPENRPENKTENRQENRPQAQATSPAKVLEPIAPDFQEIEQPILEAQNVAPAVAQFIPKVTTEAPPTALVAPEPATQVAPVPSPVPLPAPVASFKATIPAAKVESDESLAQRLQQTVRGKADDSLYGKISSGKIESLANAIPLAQRFQIINKLFKGDSTSFALAIKKLDEAKMPAQIELAIAEMVGDHQWDVDSEEFILFDALIKRKHI